MTVEQLKRTLKANPFRPFTIYMGDGKTLRVTHPEWVMPSPSGRTVAVYQSDDTFDILDLLLMTRIEVRDNPNSGEKRELRKRSRSLVLAPVKRNPRPRSRAPRTNRV